MSIITHTERRAPTSRNATITASVRPGARGVFVSGPDGFTMHWVATRRETRIHNPNDAAPLITTVSPVPAPCAG
jgi:hypothetical protein